MAAIWFIVYRPFFEFSMPMRQSFITEVSDPSQTGMMVGAGNSARSFVRSVAPTLAGYLFEFVSLAFPFFLGAAVLATNGVQYYIFYGKTKTS